MKELGYSRLEELATQALCYLCENGLFEDYLENFDLDLTPEEIEYFGLEDYIYED